MPRGDHVGRHFEGPDGLEKVFKRNRVLRDVISPKERDYVLDTLQGFRDGGGIELDRELRRASRRWSGDTDDSISRTEARVIKRELRKYGKSLESDPAPRRGGGLSLNPPYRGGSPTSMHDIRPTTTFTDPRA